jgi:adenylate kinase family enzyme
VRRISVVGNSGAGKTTFARTLATQLGVPHVELDSFFHQPNWTPSPLDVFRDQVTAALAGDGWVVDGNYSVLRDLIWDRADTVVWLDLPRPVVMRQVIARTLRRMATRETLWNGNRERWRNIVCLDPDKSIIMWAWNQHEKYRERYAAASVEPAYRHLTFVRLTSRKEMQRFAADLCSCR